MSFASTPRPNIKPYFDTTSQCSFQPRLSTGGRSHTTIEQCSNLPSVDEGKDESQKKNKIDPASTTESTESNILTEPSFETSDETTKPQKRIKRFVIKNNIILYIYFYFRSQKSFESGDENGLTAENCALLADLVEINQSLIVFAVRNSKNHSLIDRLIQLNEKNERIHFFDLFKGTINTTANNFRISIIPLITWIYLEL